MTEIEQKALALVNEVARELGWGETKEIFAAGYTRNEALFRAIEQHEAFRQEVSDAVEKQAQTVWDIHCRCGTRHPISFNTLEQFIIPAPKPDPLLAALLELELSSDLQEGQHDAKWIRNKLDELGFEIREKNDGDA